jgi:hypothetical protein
VRGASRGQQIDLYAKSGGIWWVQPVSDNPYTAIRADFHWGASIHLGVEYAALLVEPGYHPPKTTKVLPATGGEILASAVINGKGPAPPVAKSLHFSGYDWEVRTDASPRGGKNNPYSADNAWTDARGFLHLRLNQVNGRWTCAEVCLTQGLGSGLYQFTVADSSRLDPAAVMTLFTYDPAAIDQHHRQIDIEISRFGNPGGQNAQYVVQPYYDPENVVRFSVPGGG